MLDYSVKRVDASDAGLINETSLLVTCSLVHTPGVPFRPYNIKIYSWLLSCFVEAERRWNINEKSCFWTKYRGHQRKLVTHDCQTYRQSRRPTGSLWANITLKITQNCSCHFCCHDIKNGAWRLSLSERTMDIKNEPWCLEILIQRR